MSHNRIISFDKKGQDTYLYTQSRGWVINAGQKPETPKAFLGTLFCSYDILEKTGWRVGHGRLFFE